MNRILLISILLMLAFGLLAFNNSDASNIIAEKDGDYSLSLSDHRKSQAEEIADGAARLVNQSGNVNRESAAPEYNLQIELMPDGQIRINWDDIADAIGYNIYHSAYPAPRLGEAPWELWATLPEDSSEYSFYPTEAEYLNLGFFYVTALQASPPMPDNFVFIEGGSVAGITVSDFYLDKYQLTNAEWNSVMGSGAGDAYPKIYVSWFNAIEYCNLRSLQEGLTPCYSYINYGTNPDNWPSGWDTSNANHVNLSCDFSATGYRLLTEAEWEYAARGGLQAQVYTYSGSDNLSEVGWYRDNSAYSDHLVGQLTANELGIYDMSGNVHEWCWDIYSGLYRVSRGGSWYSSDGSCTISSRYKIKAAYSSGDIGFRVCRRTP